MVTAVGLIRSETDQVPELAATLAELEGVTEVFSVAGQYDLVALVRVRDNEISPRYQRPDAEAPGHQQLGDIDCVQGLFEAGHRGRFSLGLD